MYEFLCYNMVTDFCGINYEFLWLKIRIFFNCSNMNFYGDLRIFGVQNTKCILYTQKIGVFTLDVFDFHNTKKFLLFFFYSYKIDIYKCICLTFRPISNLTSEQHYPFGDWMKNSPPTSWERSRPSTGAILGLSEDFRRVFR